MNKLQLYITKTGNNFKSLFNLNPNEDISRHVRSLSSAIEKIAYNPEEKNIFYVLSSIADGIFFTILRTIPPQQGTHLAAWIFIPNGLSIDGEALEQVVRLTTRKVSNAEVTNADVVSLREAFAMEYPMDNNAPALIPSQGLDYAWRTYGGDSGFTLADFTGRGRYQQSYIPYAGVLLVDADLGYDVDADDLTNTPIGDDAVILPPEKSEEGFIAYIYGKHLDSPVHGTLGAQLTVTWRRPGFEEVSRTEVVNALEFTPSPVSTEGAHKTITPSSFFITSQVNKAELYNCSIRVNGRDITGAGYSFTSEELKHATVYISCEGHFPFSGQLDLASTTRALIQLQERRKTYCFELPVISSDFGAPIKFEIQSKEPLTVSPLEGYALLDDIQEGTTRTNHLGFVGSSTPLSTKIMYIVVGIIIGLAAMFVFNQCSQPSTTSKLSRAANPDSVVTQTNPVVEERAEATVTDITPVKEEPSKEKAAATTVDNSLTIKDAVKYLDDNTVWVREDMERNTALVGLFDDMNNFRIERLINTWGPKLKDSERFGKVVSHAGEGSRKGKAKLDGTYNKPDDTRISVQGYLNRVDP